MITEKRNQGASAFYGGRGFTAHYGVAQFATTFKKASNLAFGIDANNTVQGWDSGQTCAIIYLQVKPLELDKKLKSWLMVPEISRAIKAARYQVWISFQEDITIPDWEAEGDEDPRLHMGAGFLLHIGDGKSNDEDWVRIA